jgi:hypothetical protein
VAVQLQSKRQGLVPSVIMPGSVRFEVFTAVIMKNEEILVFLRSVHRLLATANVPSSPILVTLMMEALDSSKRRFLQEPHGVTSQKTTSFMT